MMQFLSLEPVPLAPVLIINSDQELSWTAWSVCCEHAMSMFSAQNLRPNRCIGAVAGHTVYVLCSQQEVNPFAPEPPSPFKEFKMPGGGVGFLIV